MTTLPVRRPHSHLSRIANQELLHWLSALPARLRGAALIFSLLLLANSAAAAPIDLSHRTVVESAWSPATQSGSVALPAGHDPHRTGFALLVRGWVGAETPPSINEFGTSPVRRADGWLFPLPYGLLRADAPTPFTVTPPEGSATPGAIAPAAPPILISLRDSFEEVHFEQAFYDPDAARASVVAAKGFLPGAPGRNAQPPTDPDQDRVDMEHYDITLSLTMSSTLVTGVVIARGVVVNGPLTRVALDLNDNANRLTVSAVVDADSAAPLAFSHDTTAERLFITLPAALQTGERFGVKVTYGGTPATAGQYGAPYRRTTHSGAPLIFTFSQPYGARQWWPCKDVPLDKATVDLHIDAPTGNTVVSNGILVAQTDIGGSRNRFDYSMRYPISTYLVSVTCTNYIFGSTPYTALDGDTTMTIGHFVYPENSRELQGVTGTLKAMQLFAQSFGEYPFLTDKYVTSTHASGSGMEHQTCTSMPAGNLYPDGKHRRNVHELAHQWFGDAVTCASYDHVWLNEGFATWCEAWFFELDAGPAAYRQYMQDFDNSGITDTVSLSGPDADAMTQSNVYRKGAWVVHMLRGLLGDEKFFQGMRAYFAAHKYSNADSAQFQAAMESAYGQPLDWFFTQWVYNPGRPNFSVTWSVAPLAGGSGEGELTLIVAQTQAGSPFRAPMKVAVDMLSGERRELSIVLSSISDVITLNVGTDLPISVTIDPDNWVLKTVAVPNAPVAPVALDCTAAPASLSGTMGVSLNWEHSGTGIAGFEIFTSTDLSAWTRVADLTSLDATARTWNSPSVDATRPYYARVRALTADGSPSLFSNTLGTWTGPANIPATSNASGALIVDAFARWTLDRDIPHSFVATHGAAFESCDIAFDSCASKRPAAAGPVVLSHYGVVDWLCGEESSTTESISTSEQTQLTAYLQAGGRLFITGSEIAFDLDGGSTADGNFLRNNLGSSYVVDDTFDRTAAGIAGGPFEGMAFNFGDGAQDTYRVRTPDGIFPAIAAASAVLAYGQSTYTAGVAQKATLTGGTAPAAVLFLATPLEAIYPASTRAEVLRRTLVWMGFAIAPPDVSQGWLAE